MIHPCYIPIRLYSHDFAACIDNGAMEEAKWYAFQISSVKDRCKILAQLRDWKALAEAACEIKSEEFISKGESKPRLIINFLFLIGLLLLIFVRSTAWLLRSAR